jgi:GNAT superfamily N-acetyltransferase
VTAEPLLRAASDRDEAALLALFDEAVEWLLDRGQPGQWGTEPWSQAERSRAAVRAMIAGGGLSLLEEDGVVIAALELGERWDWVAAAQEPEMYVRLLLVARTHAGRAIGAALLRRAAARARDAGVDLLRVDCWAQAPTLVAFYERCGFVKAGTFTQDGWRGQVFEQRV